MSDAVRVCVCAGQPYSVHLLLGGVLGRLAMVGWWAPGVPEVLARFCVRFCAAELLLLRQALPARLMFPSFYCVH